MLREGRDAPGAHKTMLEATKHIYKTGGLRGFYSGYIPSLVGTSHGVIQFLLYEEMKDQRMSMITDDHLSTPDLLIATSVSKIIAGVSTYPYQTLRTRLQSPRPGDASGLWDLMKQMGKQEGLKSFYKG